jgi:hypothetical protein
MAAITLVTAPAMLSDYVLSREDAKGSAAENKMVPEEI